MNPTNTDLLARQLAALPRGVAKAYPAFAARVENPRDLGRGGPPPSIRVVLRDVRCPRCNGHGRPRIVALAGRSRREVLMKQKRYSSRQSLQQTSNLAFERSDVSLDLSQGTRRLIDVEMPVGRNFVADFCLGVIDPSIRHMRQNLRCNIRFDSGLHGLNQFIVGHIGPKEERQRRSRVSCVCRLSDFFQKRPRHSELRRQRHVLRIPQFAVRLRAAFAVATNFGLRITLAQRCEDRFFDWDR